MVYEIIPTKLGKNGIPNLYPKQPGRISSPRYSFNKQGQLVTAQVVTLVSGLEKNKSGLKKKHVLNANG